MSIGNPSYFLRISSAFGPERGSRGEDFEGKGLANFIFTPGVELGIFEILQRPIIGGISHTYLHNKNFASVVSRSCFFTFSSYLLHILPIFFHVFISPSYYLQISQCLLHILFIHLSSYFLMFSSSLLHILHIFFIFLYYFFSIWVQKEEREGRGGRFQRGISQILQGWNSEFFQVLPRPVIGRNFPHESL